MGLNASMRVEVDRLLDEEPPTVMDFASVVPSFTLSSEKYYNARFP